MWNKIFRSSVVRGLETQLIYYFYVLIAILVLFFLDAIREMHKYSSEEMQHRNVGMSHLDTQMQMQMRLFRAQRNFFIAGTALFLLLVIKKMMSIISANAGLQAARAAAVKQLEVVRRDADDAGDDVRDDDGSSVKSVKKELELARKEAESARRENISLKRQSETMAREYDKLMDARATSNTATSSMRKSVFGWK